MPMNKDCINYNLSIFLSAGTGHAAMTVAFHIDSHYIVTIIPSCALCEEQWECAVSLQCVPLLYLPWVPSGSTSQTCLAQPKALCQHFCHSGFHVNIWLCKFPLYVINTKFYGLYTVTAHKSYVGFVENHIEALKCSFLHVFKIVTENSGL